MQALPQQKDLAHLGISCCIDNLSDIILESPRLIEYKQSPTPENKETTTKKNNVMRSPPKSEPSNGQQRRRLSSRMSNSLRRSSKDLMSSFTKSLTSHTDKTSPCPSSAAVEPVPQVSAAEAAKLGSNSSTIYPHMILIYLYIHKDVKLIYEKTEGWQVCVIDENGREIEISDPSWDVQVRPEVRI